MYVLVGLGNPGEAYNQTRHNVGFDVVDAIAQYFHFEPYKTKFKSHYTEGVIDGKRILILKPQLYMNKSGISVRECIKFYKVPLTHVMVFHDDLDVDVGRVKVKTGGGAAGHNGLRSLDAHVGSEYMRVRLGISHPGHKDQVTDYVLKRFSKADYQVITTLIDRLTTHIPVLIRGDRELFLTRTLGEPREKVNEE